MRFLLAAIFVHALAQTLIVPLLPKLSRSFGTSSSSILAAEMAFPFFAAISFPLLGFLTDKLGARRTMRLSLLGQTIGFLLLFTAHSIPIFFLARAVSGLASGVLPIAIAHIRRTVEPRRQLAVSSAAMAILTIGAATGPIIGAVFLPFGLLAGAVFAAVLTLSVFILSRSSQTSIPSTPSTTSIPSPPFPIPLLALTLAMTILGGGFQITRLLIPFEATARFAFSTEHIAWAIALLSIGAVVTQIALTLFHHTRRLGVGYAIAAYLMIIGMSAIASYTLPIFWLGIILLALGTGIADPIGAALIARYTNNTSVGRVTGIIFFFSSLAKVAAPAIAGWIISRP